MDYRRFFEYPPSLIQFKDALLYQFQQFPEFAFSDVRIVTRNEIYHRNDQGISDYENNVNRLPDSCYYFVFAFKYESSNPIPGFRKLIKILYAAFRYIHQRQSYGFCVDLYPRTNNQKVIKDKVELDGNILSEIYKAVVTKTKPGSTAFYKYFWIAYEVMELLVSNETTYPSLIRVFHGFDNVKDTIRCTINRQVDSGDYHGGPRKLLKCTKLKKDIIKKNIDFDVMTEQAWSNWEVLWMAVNHSERLFSGHFFPFSAQKSPDSYRNYEQIRNACYDGKLNVKEVQAYEYDNDRRFSFIIYLGYIQSKHNFTIDVILSFYALKEYFDLFCEQIKELFPNVRKESLDEISSRFTKPADIF